MMQMELKFRYMLQFFIKNYDKSHIEFWQNVKPINNFETQTLTLIQRGKPNWPDPLFKAVNM